MSKRQKKAKPVENQPKKSPPIKIPIPFEKAVEGLLAVKPLKEKKK